jgi:hypothetical protein
MNWLKNIFNRNTNPLKTIIDSAIDEFVRNDKNGTLEKVHDKIYILFDLFTDEPNNIQVIIDHQTTILTIPFDTERVSRYLSYLYKSPPKAHIYDESVYHLEEHNLICYIENGTHRLAALNLYYRDQHESFVFDEKRIRRKKINVDVLKRYHLDKKRMVLYKVNPSYHLKIIDRIELSPILYDIILTFQKHYFSKANMLDKNMSDLYASLWTKREKNHMDHIQELFNPME